LIFSGEIPESGAVNSPGEKELLNSSSGMCRLQDRLPFYRNNDGIYAAGIRMRKKQIAAFSLALWLFIIAYFMLFGERFDLGLFFVLGFIGFLMIVELLEPRYVKPAYLRYIRLLTIAGIIISGFVVTQKLMEILGLYFTWSF
jgi:hypothetical protein